MKIFLDDIREPYSTHHVKLPLGPWEVVRNYDEFVKKITDYFDEMGVLPSFISFDFDLTEESYLAYKWGEITQEEFERVEINSKTGLDCAQWLVDFCINKKCFLPNYMIHSMNKRGGENIKNLLNNFENKIT